jgi:translation elongation factor EF-1alpha
VQNYCLTMGRALVGVVALSAVRDEAADGLAAASVLRDHLLLGWARGVRRLVVAITKMDAKGVDWKESVYLERIADVLPLVKRMGFVRTTH